MKKILFILVFSLFVFIPKDVFAQQLIPSFVTYSDGTIQSPLDVSSFTHKGIISTYGFRWNVSTKRSAFTWVYSNTGLDFNKKYDISFAITDSSYSKYIVPYTVFIKDTNNNISYCETSFNTINMPFYRPITSSQGDSTNNIYGDSTTTYYDTNGNVAVSCKNVTITGDFRIIQLNDFYSTVDGVTAITALNINENSSNQVIENQEQTNDKLDDLNDNITNSDTSGASSSASDFFNNFEYKTYGLTDIITAPLTFIQGMANSTCTDLSLPLPFVDQDVKLPCMTPIYKQYFGGFLTIYQIITFGIVGYWVSVNVLRMVNNFKNPDNDEVEVMDL